MDTDQIESLINAKTKAIMMVHIYGLPVDVDPLLMPTYGKVFMNGNWLIVTKKLYGLYSLLKKKRKDGKNCKYIVS